MSKPESHQPWGPLCYRWPYFGHDEAQTLGSRKKTQPILQKKRTIQLLKNYRIYLVCWSNRQFSPSKTSLSRKWFRWEKQTKTSWCTLKSKKDKTILTLYIEKLKQVHPQEMLKKKGSQRNPPPLNNKLEVN